MVRLILLAPIAYCLSDHIHIHTLSCNVHAHVTTSKLTPFYTAANQMAQQMSQMNPGAANGMFQPGQDPDKMFLSEAENLEVVEHWFILDDVESRLLVPIQSQEET